jgi:hypothetical protein
MGGAYFGRPDLDHYYTRLYIGDLNFFKIESLTQVLLCIVLRFSFHLLSRSPHHGYSSSSTDMLENIRTCSVSDLEILVSDLSLDSDARIPFTFLAGLNHIDNTICWRAILLCYLSVV